MSQTVDGPFPLNPLEHIPLGNDSLVREFLIHTFSHKPVDSWQGELTSEQHKEVDRVTEAISKALEQATGHQRIEYLERKLAIVAGPFCGATTHAADLLTRLGVPCSHEIIMREGGLFPYPVILDAYRAECSGDSARWVNVLENAPLVHLIRDPLKTANSFYRLRMGKIFETDCIGYVLNFHKCIEARKPNVVWRIERHEDLLPVLRFFGVKTPMGRIDRIREEARKNPHRKGTEDVIKWDDFPRSLQKFAEKHGYGPTGREIFETDKKSW